MNSKFFLIVLVFLLIGSVFVSVVSAITKTGEYEGSFDVDVGEAGIIIEPSEPEECQEDWSCSYWTTCSAGSQEFTCVDCNKCGTYDMRPEACWTTRTCGTTNGDGGNSGGGGSSCNENWECSGWSSCVSGRQTRTCTDLADCRTTYYKPATTRVCLAGLSETNSGTTEQEEEKVTLIENSDSEPDSVIGITGAVIGALGKKSTILITSFIIGILALIIITLIVKRKQEAGIVRKVNKMIEKK